MRVFSLGIKDGPLVFNNEWNRRGIFSTTYHFLQLISGLLKSLSTLSWNDFFSKSFEGGYNVAFNPVAFPLTQLEMDVYL